MTMAMADDDSIRQALGGEIGEHPTYEMLEQIVDGTADDVTREIVESHAEVCPACNAELRDLTELAVPPSSSRAWIPWLAAAAAIIVVILTGAYLLTRREPVSPPVVTTTQQPVTRTVDASPYGRADWDAAVRDAIARGAIDAPPRVRELQRPRDILRRPGDAPAEVVMSPAGTVVESATPALTWSAKPGRYVVSIFDGFDRVAQSDVLRSGSWRVTKMLARGRTYTWQVEIRRGASVETLPAPPAPPALFYVVGERDAAMLAEAQRRFPNDHLLLGVLHARLGMQQAALEELRIHAAQHPEARHAAALADAVARW
jgi:hypothetical protein